MGTLMALLPCLWLVAAPPLRVGVFEGNGASPDCVVETLEALLIDPGIRARRVCSIAIARGDLARLDVLVFPGGSGSREYLDLGSGLRERIRGFVRDQGRGVVGICAGAYLLSDTPTYPCLNLLSAKAIDMEHDERGSAVVKVAFTQEGKRHFPEIARLEAGYLQYHDGPVFLPSPGCTVLANFLSDIHLGQGAPAGLTPGKPFLLCQYQGKGRVFAAVGHPESTAGMRWMVPRMVRWAAGRETVPYAAAWVRPGFTDREILHDDAKEEDAFWKLIAPEEARALDALTFLAGDRYRNGFRWAKGLLRDRSPAVRRKAAEVIADFEYTAALPDLEEALRTEGNTDTRKELVRQIQRLRVVPSRSK